MILKEEFEKEMPDIIFRDVEKYDTFGIVLNIDELIPVANIITRVLL